MKPSVDICNTTAREFEFGYADEVDRHMAVLNRPYFNEMLKLVHEEFIREEWPRKIHSITIFLISVSVIQKGLENLAPMAFGLVAELLKSADAELGILGQGRKYLVAEVPEERRAHESVSLRAGEREMFGVAINVRDPVRHAQRLRALISELAAHHATSFHIGVTVGVASTSITDKKSLSEVLHEADGALRAVRWKGSFLPGDDDMLFCKDSLAFLV